LGDVVDSSELGCGEVLDVGEIREQGEGDFAGFADDCIVPLVSV
jgi:hypothetical protein